MPAIESREIGVAVDMHGCPNRCRHCWLGRASNSHMTEDDLRWMAAQFRSYVKSGEDRPFIENLSVSSWFREPDYSDDWVGCTIWRPNSVTASRPGTSF